ncbi:phosphoglycerate dehydrogenase-like enzyme [Scopulibacillus darangshiensis]|uniref:Phosphoglycerate dehydrogenase-like enzyme n=1 Tax=Scopulibacillus darangshiensis TaxID=442528 RepID=A0A4R2NRW2_9BACL|nr:D-2-hydroxyacid dehydrogenase [Scopulibacillus darangshiensis]TCP24567.1 phosphoglycerate dehydrogenase-like enzyme [Scopulibacillus darangshiensis]
MNVVTSAKIRRDLREALINEFPNAVFSFHSNIRDAATRLKDADILITYGEDLTDSIINAAENLKWIMVISAGLDLMPFDAINKKGILVTNAKGIHKIPMAEYTLGMMLQYVKRLRTFDLNQREHKWDKAVKTSELAGKRITIIGPGAIGGEIARLAKAFRMTTAGVNRSGHPIENIDQIYLNSNLLDALKDADFVVSVLPSTKETYHLINKTHFQAMKQDAVFINIGRGKTVDQRDLLEALKEGMISHAILDVFEKEPLNEEHPFWKMDQVTLTPHISSISSEYQPRSIDIFKENLSKYLAGENDYINKIDLEKGY